MKCGGHSHRADLVVSFSCGAIQAVVKSKGSPASSHAGAQNMGPGALNRWTAANNSGPCTWRRLPPRWQGSSRPWVTADSVLSQPNTCCQSQLSNELNSHSLSLSLSL